MSEYQPTVDQEATNKFGEIFDQLLTENPDVLKTAKGRHALNVFFTQLLFCFFAEDTGIFTENQFTNAVGSHTQADGSDVADFLAALFTALDTEDPAVLVVELYWVASLIAPSWWSIGLVVTAWVVSRDLGG